MSLAPSSSRGKQVPPMSWHFVNEQCYGQRLAVLQPPTAAKCLVVSATIMIMLFVLIIKCYVVVSQRCLRLMDYNYCDPKYTLTMVVKVQFKLRRKKHCITQIYCTLDNNTIWCCDLHSGDCTYCIFKTKTSFYTVIQFNEIQWNARYENHNYNIADCFPINKVHIEQPQHLTILLRFSKAPKGCLRRVLHMAHPIRVTLTPALFVCGLSHLTMPVPALARVTPTHIRLAENPVSCLTTDLIAKCPDVRFHMLI